MVKDIENKKRKASVPADEVAKVKKAKKVAADVAEPAKKRKAIDDAAPVKVKKSKTPKPSIDEAPKPKPAKKVTTPAKAVESEIPVVAPVKDTKKSKDSAAKEVKAEDATESEIKSISKAKPKKEPKREPKKADDTIYSSEEDEAEEKEDAEAVEEDADALSEDDDQTEAFLKGFESDEEEHVTDVAEPAEVPTLNKKLKKQAKKAAEAAAGDRPGVVYIGRIPHGFYENEMREYFKQFGTIQSLRLARNRKTGASKHIAWIKFESSTVADIVAKTMDNYLLFEHILKVKIIPEEQVPENLFKGANKRFKKVPWNKIAGRKLKQGASETTWDKRIEKEEERRKIKADKMKEIGYEYEAPKIKSTKDVAKKGEKLVITADGEAEKEEPKAIEAPPAVEESPKSKKKGKKAKAAEVPALVEDAPNSVLEAKEITPIATETVVEEVVEAPEKKVKKKSKTTVIEKEAAALVVETPATSGGAKKLKKKSKSALA